MTDFKELELTLAEISTAITEAKERCAKNGYQWNRQNERIAITQATVAKLFNSVKGDEAEEISALCALRYKGYVKLADFEQWIDKTFSDGITKAQMLATNTWQQKVELEGKDG